MCGFNLVRVPLSSSFSGEGGNHTDPFRNPHHIPLCMTNDACIAAGEYSVVWCGGYILKQILSTEVSRLHVFLCSQKENFHASNSRKVS